MPNKIRAPKNRTISLTDFELKEYEKKLVSLSWQAKLKTISNSIICQDFFKVVEYLPQKFVDLLFIDPPYNLRKTFNLSEFKEKSIYEYAEWIDGIIKKIIPLLKPSASIYFCSDWKSSTSVHIVLEKYFKVRNRITWEREKGRGAKTNWKNNLEDIWFCTVSSDYVFNVDAVKLKRTVLAPYRDSNGQPKDWISESDKNFRLTHPSNIWNDISVPFWSMPENTDHPTQKPEKLLAKIILASSNRGHLVFDPFLGSGTTAVVAKKLGRNFAGIEVDKEYACLALKRLEIAEKNKSIQGYSDGVFWERNSL
ncbi:MAG: DNA methyltransferase [bacterium]